MIHKIIKGSYFKGALRYVLDPSKGALIGGTFGSHQSPSQVAHEMKEIAGERLKKPVFHAVLSLRPGESLTNDQWNAAARSYLGALGYDDAPYVLVRHSNREHDHVHIIASRVRYDGSVVADRNDRYKGLAAVRELSRELALSVGASPSPLSLRAAEVRALVRSAAEGQPSFAAFLARLESVGVRVTAHVSSGRTKVQGLSFHLDGSTFKASQLGRDLSWRGLQRIGVRYDPAKDLPLALEHTSRAAHQDSRSAWSPGAIRDLSRRLRAFPAGARAASNASRELSRHGAEAFRLSAHVARFLEGGLRPSEAALRTARKLSASDNLSLALSFLGAFRSPGAAALFLLRISQRATAPAKGAHFDPAALFLRQLSQAAASDGPTFDVFRNRLIEAGVHLEPGVFVLPDRLVPGHTIGLDASQLEKLGVQDARERFGRPGRPVRGGDRDRRGNRSDPPGGGQSPDPGFGPDRGFRPEPDRAAGANREAHAVPPELDRRIDLGRHPPAQQPQAPRDPDLDHGIRPDSRNLSSSPGELDRSPATVVPDRATPGPTQDRTPSRGAALPSAGGSPTAAFVPSPGALHSDELTRHLRALGEGGAEIRIRFSSQAMTQRVSLDKLDEILPALFDHARRGALLEIRSLDPRIQHLSGLRLEAIERARLHGAEPAALLQRGDGTYDAWLRHGANATPETLPYLRRTLRVEYGQPPLGRSMPFGPMPGVGSSTRLVEATGRPYTRAQALADFFVASRRAVEEQLARRLQSVGVSSLAHYRISNPGPAADREWSRFALRQGLAPRDVALELIRSGARAQAGSRAQALYASRILASTLPAGARDLPRQLLHTASQVLGVSTNVLSIVRTVFHHVARLTLGRT